MNQLGTCKSEKKEIYRKVVSFLKSYLSVQRKSIKPHRTDKIDMSGLGIHYLLVTCDPQTCVLRQHFNNLKNTVLIYGTSLKDFIKFTGRYHKYV